jgi:2-polyprenyl-3-methyl-5-hydroxy-6-metoxy-1,4-benzoquinol methylase
VTTPERYEQLAAAEARHWGSVDADPQNPQLWHDDRLFDIFFGTAYRHFVDRIIAAGPEVLELGCGEGNLALELAGHGSLVTAVDLSPERIERATARASSLRTLKPTFRVADVNTMRMTKQKYDCIVAHDALHHLYNLDKVLDEASQALKQNGRLITIDYVGMKTMRKLAAAFLYALLPTYQTYRYKWQLRHRLQSFFASESSKREAVESGRQDSLHHDSPFEEISQDSIIRGIRQRFDVVEIFTFSPFWFYLAPKIRTPRSWKYAVARLLKKMDDLLLAIGVGGAYVFLEAKRQR